MIAADKSGSTKDTSIEQSGSTKDTPIEQSGSTMDTPIEQSGSAKDTPTGSNNPDLIVFKEADHRGENHSAYRINFDECIELLIYFYLMRLYKREVVLGSLTDGKVWHTLKLTKEGDVRITICFQAVKIILLWRIFQMYWIRFCYLQVNVHVYNCHAIFGARGFIYDVKVFEYDVYIDVF